MIEKIKVIKLDRDRIVLIYLSLISITIQIIWLTVDKSIPAWDQSAHLINALNFQRVVEKISLFSSGWWHEFWAQTSSYRAPLVYILTVPYLSIFGKGLNTGLLVNTLFIPVIVSSTYYLSRQVFSSQVSRWAAGLCLLFPTLVDIQLDYLLDYGIVATIIFAFLALTLWKDAKSRFKSWQWSLIFGAAFGLMMLSKPTGFLFLFLPIIFLLGSFIQRQDWIGLIQIPASMISAWLVCGSWYSQNWLTIITSTASKLTEAGPGGNTLFNKFYYFIILPDLVSLPILAGAAICLVLWFSMWGSIQHQIKLRDCLWLILYLVGGYLFCSLTSNKTPRFIAPVLPVFSIFLAYFLNLFQTIWAKQLRWGIVGLSSLMLLVHLFPIVGTNLNLRVPALGYAITRMANPKVELTHQQVVQEIITKQPYLKNNIGTLTSSQEFNPENLDFYGSVANFQISAREFSTVAPVSQFVEKDGKALSWYLIKTGEIGHVNKLLPPIVEQDSSLQFDRSWQMLNGDTVKLYARKDMPIVVEPTSTQIQGVRLDKVIISPTKTSLVNTTYQLSGDRASLQNGLLLLDWQSKGQTWNHDGAIGLESLYLDKTSLPNFQITEHLAMLPPDNLALSEYQLKVTYLDKKTGKTYPLEVPTIQIEPTSDRASQLDLISRLHQLGKLFAKGNIDSVFSEIAILNQYDPIQQYLIHAQQAIAHRIGRGDPRLELRYTLALTQALKIQVEPLLDNLTQIIKLDPQNPAAWTYLAVVRLYNWQPIAAEMAIKQAESLPSPPAALSTLKIISSLFRFDFPQMWQRIQLG